MKTLRDKSWSPYAVGAGIGVLSWFAFATVDRGLGISTAFEYTAALFERWTMAGQVADNSYFASHSPAIDWEWMLVLGVFVGSFLSSKLSGDRGAALVPALWRARFGTSPALRLTFAFLGGAVMMFGARLAQGCTSGHGITGTLQLAVSSWSFILLAFGTAAVTAFALYGRTRGQAWGEP